MGLLKELKETDQLSDVDEQMHWMHNHFEWRTLDEELDRAIARAAEKQGTTEATVSAILGRLFGGQTVQRWRTLAVPRTTEISIERSTAIRIVFALKMTYEEANDFLGRIRMDRFHMRNVEDVIYRFGLKNGWNYATTSFLVKEFEDFNNPEPEDANIAMPSGVTKLLDDEFAKLGNDEYDLRSFLDKQ